MRHQDISDFEAVAGRINTGTDNPDNSRALIVFNLTEQPLSGIAVFQASMSWPINVPLPLVAITDISPVPAVLKDLVSGPDAKGRADRRQLTFSLCFAVSDIAANGWSTYIASYSKTPSPPLKDFLETPGLIVVETTRHGGDLLPAGNF